MRKTITLAVAFAVALVAGPAFASTQNVKISGSIDSSYIYRNNFDLGTIPVGDNNQIEDTSQSIFITQTILHVDADLTDQVSTTVGLINERVWDATQAATNNDINLYLAYVTLREMLYSPLTVVAGRQVFSYGNSLIVDATGTNDVAPAESGISTVADDLTKATALDAIRMIFDYNPLTLELVFAKLDENTAGAAVDSDHDDSTLYGINTTYELGDDMDTEVEAYFFARINESGITTTAGSKSDTLYVPGLRASANVLDGLNIQGEVAWQRGNNINSTATGQHNQERDAIAAQFISNYQIPNDILPDGLEEYNPVLNYTYTYVSGDSNPTDGSTPTESSTNKDTAWDPFLEAQGGGTIYNNLFSLTNMQIHSVTLTANPMEDLTTSVSWHGLWLDKSLDTAAATSTFTLGQPDGTAPAPAASNTETDLGYEIDVNAVYDYTEDVQIGASLGWFSPGDVFTTTNDAVASQAIVHGNVNF